MRGQHNTRPAGIFAVGEGCLRLVLTPRQIGLADATLDFDGVYGSLMVVSEYGLMATVNEAPKTDLWLTAIDALSMP